MIKIICDKCNREINERKENVWYVSFGINTDPLNDVIENEICTQDTEFKDWHLCPDCINEIKKFIKNETNMDKPKEKVKIKTKSSEEPKARNRVDIGKIMALKNAGWSNIKIADEMGMTPNNVAQNIFHYKKKQAEGA